MLATTAAKGLPRDAVGREPLRASNFTNKQGFLAAGDDILSGSYDFTDAAALCGANDIVS